MILYSRRRTSYSTYCAYFGALRLLLERRNEYCTHTHCKRLIPTTSNWIGIITRRQIIDPLLL